MEVKAKMMEKHVEELSKELRGIRRMLEETNDLIDEVLDREALGEFVEWFCEKEYEEIREICETYFKEDPYYTEEDEYIYNTMDLAYKIYATAMAIATAQKIRKTSLLREYIEKLDKRVVNRMINFICEDIPRVFGYGSYDVEARINELCQDYQKE